MPRPDALVCGAGPAGAIAAFVMARAGLRVRLVDRARFPREKLCGDTVNPGALALLRRLGLDRATDGGLPIDGMIVSGDGGVRCTARYAGAARGVALRRALFDAALLDRALQAGVEFEDRVVVREPIVDGGAVRGVLVAGANGASRRVEARVTVAADGSGSRLARALGLASHAARPRRWAVGGYYTGVETPDDRGTFGEMHLRADRYIGVAPMPGGVTNACVVTAVRDAVRDPAALLRETLRCDPMLAARFASASPASRPICLGPLAVDGRACGVPGLLLAGDAAGFIDPMTGDGLYFAVRGAELAAEAAIAALASCPGEAARGLEQRRRREFGTKWRFNRALRAMSGSPAALRLAAAGAKWSPAMIERIVHYAGDVPRG